MAEGTKRVDIGFTGGQVLSVRTSDAALQALRDVLTSDGRWHEIEAEDSVVSVDLQKIVYVRLDTDKQRVGF
jgi:hypothetical protein